MTVLDNPSPPSGPNASGQVFNFFTEVGIIHQLSTALLAQVLPDGVHPSHFAIMNHLTRRGDGRTPIAIARAMQVTKNTMTHSLKVLGDRDYIRVGPNPDDARGKLVFLTDPGRHFHARAIAAVSERFQTVVTQDFLSRIDATLADLVEIRKHLDDNR